jgi:hypothetical protein
MGTRVSRLGVVGPAIDVSGTIGVRPMLAGRSPVDVILDVGGHFQ